MFKIKIYVVLIIILNLIVSIKVFAADEATFSSVAPDALIVLDLSSSMAWNPTGGSDKDGGNNDAGGNAAQRIYGNASCSNAWNDFTTSPDGTHTTDCRRIQIAKNAIKGILDDNHDGLVTSPDDDNSLGIRIGYMRFKDCGPSSAETGGTYSYTAGCNTLIQPIATTYATIWSSVNAETTNGNTPVAAALYEAKMYLDVHKAADSAKTCRQKFVILITDGDDTLACNSTNGSSLQADQYKRRRESVAAAKALNDAGYRVYVVGLGANMPSYLQNTLNWMAYYGGTQDASATTAGAVTAYSLPTDCDTTTKPASCCKESNLSACYPTGITRCTTSDTNPVAGVALCDGNNTGCYAVSNDPGDGNVVYNSDGTVTLSGKYPLSGYAFIAADADALRTALAAAFGAIRDSTYSFTTGSIQAVRTIDENYLYEASFYPLLAPHNDPLWLGYLKRYTILPNGSITAASDWDAGSILQARAGGDSCSAGRCVYTAIGGSTTAFDKANTNITYAKLGVTNNTKRDAVIDFIRKGESSATTAKSENPGWKLGDIFHSQPVTVGTPSAYYYDRVDTLNTPPAFDTFRANHPRSSASGNRLVLAGANDGQLHAFKAGETSAGGGSEVWSFIPPNFLTSLNGIVHSTHPTNLAHQYFVDGPISASDVWLPQWSGSTNAIGTKKNATDWHTLVVFGERGISNATLWSKVASCDSGFSSTYSATYGYYCGYHALDVTATTSSPIYKWHWGGSAGKLTSGQASYLGSPWSKMILGRVRVSGNEKWVGFVGGGYSSSKSGKLGRSFYVIDLSDGSILWQYTNANSSTMTNALAGPPASVDTDNDGFVDTVYIGDLGSNVWRFKFCTAAQDNPSGSCGTSNWVGGLLFQADANSGIRPIYTMPSVARDDVGNIWVYFGTGDVSDPTASNAQERFFAVKDNDRSSTWKAGNLEHLQQASDIYGGSGDGWYFNLPGQGIKILADPTVFNGVVYFTAYTPGNANDPCAKGGQADLYAMDYKTGQGEFVGNVRSENIGEGIPSAPVVSLNPYGGTDIYVSTSEISGTNNDTAHTQKQDAPTGQNFNKTNLLFWRDMRVQ